MDQAAIAKAVENKGALAHINTEQVLDRIASGEIMRTIAAEYGVAKQSLRERLLRHPRYAETIKEQAESIVEYATAECMGCDADMPVIARARLKLEAAHKWAAARDPQNWGTKQQVTVNQGITVDQALDGMAASLLAKMRVVSDDAAQQVQCNMDDAPNNEAGLEQKLP